MHALENILQTWVGLLADALVHPALALLGLQNAAWVQQLAARTEAKDWLLLALAPVFAVTLLAEWLALRKRAGIYKLSDSMASMNLGGIYLTLDLLLLTFFVVPLYYWAYGHRVATIPINGWTFAALYVAVDFSFYVFHRASHRIRWFWCAHVVHHASEHMNFTTAMRQSIFYNVAGQWLFYIPLVFIGFEPVWVVFALSLNLGYQFFLHTQWVNQLPAPIEFIFNTPSHHRAHHGRNPVYIDRNYGGTLIVWDRLFGTFVPEDVQQHPVDYGIVRQVRSNNPLWLNLHEWVDMFADALRPGPLSQRFKHLWAPPEWGRPGPAQSAQSPAGRAQTQG
jgi:sterol desaturase/sphingolipid hydroxylase (fatty acid hydroxylase superfamily)